MTQIKLRRDTSADFTSKNPILGVGEPAYETDTKKLKIGDGTTAYNSLSYFSMTDEFATYRKKYGAPSDSVPVVNTGNSITIKAGVSIETPNGTLTNATDMTYTYDFLTDRVLFVTENDYYHAYAVYYGGKEPSPVGEQIFWFNNNVWTMISGDGAKTVFNTQKITPIAKIYQTDGTVKNIDYSSYTKTSAGGGGSTNISATLPLKIVDGVISLEVDGQTIQIVDGKLHANLDELGNKVNSLTGEVTDLSGRVTAAEADILTKENKITTTGALSLQEKIISNLTNMTETETQITPNKSQYFTVNQSEFYFSNQLYNAPQCYIAIPYQFGQWLKIPGGRNIQPSVLFGHFLEDGDFLITAVFSGNCYERNYPIYGGIVRGTAPVSFSTYSGSFYLNSYGAVSEKAMESNIQFTETDPCAYLQLIDNTSSNNIICGSYNYGYGPNSSGIKGYAETHVVYNSDLTNYTVQDFVRDTTTALIMSPSASYPILKSAVGLYAATGRLGWNQDGYNQLKANLGENLFDLTKSQVNNYLELNIGSGLSVVDGKLTASSTAPANMVTTDTAQTISGDKEFTGITTISNDIKLTTGKKITTPDGQWLMQLGTGFIGIGTSMGPLQTYDGSNYYLHNKSVIAGDGIKITEPSNSEIQISSTIGNKETIMGYIMPDYSTKTAVPWNTDNTAPTDGYVEVFGKGDGSDADFALEYLINGTMTRVSNGYTPLANATFRLPVICPKGTIYRATGGVKEHELYFISMKGAV